MRPALSIARHDLKLVLSDRSAVLWMFVLPIAFAAFFGLVMGGHGGAPQDPRARLTLIDMDHSPLSRSFVESLDDQRLEVVEIAAEDRDTTADKIRTLVIPEGFGAAALAGEQMVLELEKDPDTSPEAALMAEARITAAIARLIAQLVEASTALPDGAQLSKDMLVQAAPVADLISVSSRFAGHASVTPDGFAQSIPGNAVMFVMLVALTYGAASISGERQGGLLRRLVTAPVRRRDIIAGKLLGRILIAATQITEYVLVGALAQLLFDIQIENLCGIWVVLLLFATATAPLGLVLGGLFTDPDRAASVGVIATMAMAALGGCWWPIEVVSPTMQRLALVFPSGWAMHALHGVISFGDNTAKQAPALAVLAGFAVVFTLVANRTLRVD